jgi:hypothetical protein
MISAVFTTMVNMVQSMSSDKDVLSGPSRALALATTGAAMSKNEREYKTKNNM